MVLCHFQHFYLIDISIAVQIQNDWPFNLNCFYSFLELIAKLKLSAIDSKLTVFVIAYIIQPSAKMMRFSKTRIYEIFQESPDPRSSTVRCGKLWAGWGESTSAGAVTAGSQWASTSWCTGTTRWGHTSRGKLL